MDSSRSSGAETLHFERIDDGDLVIGCHLKQAKFRIIGLLAKKLGIDGENRRRPRALDERLEAFLTGYVHRDDPYVELCSL